MSSILNTIQIFYNIICIQNIQKMKNDKNRQRPNQPLQLNRMTSQSGNQLQQLRQKLKALKQTAQQKQNQILEMSSQLRKEGVKNQKLRKQVIQIDERINTLTQMQVQLLFDKYKDNKSSPLFYNENGLSPFDLVRIGEKKFQEMGENHICMVCFVDLEKGARIMKLPCSHILHKECGIQHLLYSKQCPACTKDLK